MTELERKIYNLIKEPVLSVFCTITEDGKPWGRYVMIHGQEDLMMRFATFVNARKVLQIKNNPEVHLTCGVTDPMQDSSYIQVQGKARLLTDKETRYGFWTDMMDQYFKGPDDPNYGVVEIKPYRIEYWSHGSFEPQIWQD